MLGATWKFPVRTENCVFVCANLKCVSETPFEVMSLPFGFSIWRILSCFKDKQGGGESEHINLKVLGQDNAVVQFKIKRHTPLRKLMNAYCDRAVSFSHWLMLGNNFSSKQFFVYFHQGLSMQVVRFRFDGSPINENDTPTSLEMEEGDTIEVYQQQTGGGFAIVRSQLSVFPTVKKFH